MKRQRIGNSCDRDRAFVSAGIARGGCGTRQTWASHRLLHMSHLTHEQQVFVLHQLRNWLFGHYPVFNALNAAWAPHGAKAYFWN